MGLEFVYDWFVCVDDGFRVVVVMGWLGAGVGYGSWCRVVFLAMWLGGVDAGCEEEGPEDDGGQFHDDVLMVRSV